METAELEARTTALKEKVAQIQQEQQSPDTGCHEWLDRVFGIFADNPEFEEAVKAGQEWRKTEAVFADL